MKRILPLGMLACVLTATATEVELSQLTPSAVMNTEVKQAASLKLDNNIISKDPGITRTGIRRAPATSDIITVPADGEAKIMEGESLSTYPLWGSVFQNPDVSSARDVVIGDDGYIYIKNILAGLPTETWIKGYKWGERVYFSFPQAITLSDTGEVLSIYKCVLKTWEEGGQTYSTYEPDQSTQTSIFSYADGVLKQEDDGMLGLCIELNSGEESEIAWVGYGEELIYMEDFEQPELTQFPEGSEPESFIFKWNQYDGAQGRYVNGVISGDKVYFDNYLGNGQGVITGTIEGDIVTFPSFQYLGIYDHHFAYFSAAHLVLDEADPYYGYMVGDTEATFTLDRTSNTLTLVNPSQSLLINAGDEQIYYSQYYENASFFPGSITETSVPGKPCNVSCEDHRAYEHPYSYFLMFDLPLFNENNQLFPADRLYYRIFADGTPIEWEPLDGSQYVPYSATAQDTYYSYNSFHMVYIADPDVKVIGIQSCYLNSDDEFICSEIVNVNADASVMDVVNDAPVSEEYYSLDGIKVDNPGNGFYVKVTSFANGTRAVSKVLLR